MVQSGVSGMDMLMSQMTGMAMMKGNVDFQSLLWTMFVVLFLQKIIGYMPKIGEFISKRIEGYMKKSTSAIIDLPNSDPTKKETSSIIYTRSYDNDDSTKTRVKLPKDYIVADSILDCACKNDNAISLRSNGMYYVNHSNEVSLGDGVFFKLLSNTLGDNEMISGLSIKVYSYTHTLTNLRRKIEKIYEDYQAEIQNELGEKLYYFEDIPIAIPKQINMKTKEEELRYELAPKTLQFRMNPFYTSKSLDNVYGNAMKIVRSRIRFFMNNREWYDTRGIPYTIGLLLYGPPGCGKTSLIKAIANECNRHVFSIRMSDHTTRSQLTDLFFSESIHETTGGKTRSLTIPMKKRLLVFEDVDTMCDAVKSRTGEVTEIENTGEPDEDARSTPEGPPGNLPDDVITSSWKTIMPELRNIKNVEDLPMFTNIEDLKASNDIGESKFGSANHGMENADLKTPSEKLDLGTLLNLMDGILETPGRIIVMTSNHPEVLDPALIRPGRIDLIIKFDNSTQGEIQEIYNGLTGKSIPENILSKIPNKKYSPAKITQSIFENFDNPEQGIRKLASH
jgi:SpoVK/Ycf46/Vps4 family AAA+-type ATPase